METSYSKTHSRSNIHFNSLPRRSKTVSLALPPLPGTDLALSKEQAAFMVARSKSAMQDPSDLDNDKAQKPRLITFNSPRSSKQVTLLSNTEFMHSTAQVPDMDLLHKMREKDAECTEAPEANATFPFVFLPEASLRREVSQRVRCCSYL